jgi:hypothetical protein
MYYTVYYILLLLVYTSTFSVYVIFLAHHVHFSRGNVDFTDVLM